MNKNKYPDDILAATTLLLAVSNADDNIDNNEIKTILDIITDFFKINKESALEIIEISQSTLRGSTDIYEFGKILNNSFKYQDKVDFICCAFEVAYSDNNLHYFEEHFIKKISYILNVEHKDLVKSKTVMKEYFS
tara:strand:- start:127 stop:531 length:405 start_codon:yes stop_codon:yes gene_type:complete